MDSMFGDFAGDQARVAKLVAEGFRRRWKNIGEPVDANGRPVIRRPNGKIGAVSINHSWRIVDEAWGMNKHLYRREFVLMFVPIVYLISRDDGRDVMGPEIGRDITAVLNHSYEFMRELEESGQLTPYQEPIQDCAESSAHPIA